MIKKIKFSTGLLMLVISGSAFSLQARSGEEIYKTKCFVCHMTGAGGAPKLEDKAAWAPRLKSGLETLLNSVKNGRNFMPPKGTCMDCTDAELKAAVKYMMSQAQ